MLWAHPLAGFGVPGGVFVDHPVGCRHAVAALVRVRALAFVSSLEDTTVAGLPFVPFIAEGDGSTGGSHFPSPLPLMCNGSKFDVHWPHTGRVIFPIVRIVRWTPGVIGAQLIIFPFCLVL